jgi:hypothetical protein
VPSIRTVKTAAGLSRLKAQCAASAHLRVLLSNRRLLKRKFIAVENELRGSLKAFGIVPN